MHEERPVPAGHLAVRDNSRIGRMFTVATAISGHCYIGDDHQGVVIVGQAPKDLDVRVHFSEKAFVSLHVVLQELGGEAVKEQDLVAAHEFRSGFNDVSQDPTQFVDVSKRLDFDSLDNVIDGLGQEKFRSFSVELKNLLGCAFSLTSRPGAPSLLSNIERKDV